MLIIPYRVDYRLVNSQQQTLKKILKFQEVFFLEIYFFLKQSTNCLILKADKHLNKSLKSL
jgi:hypothetical protein